MSLSYTDGHMGAMTISQREWLKMFSEGGDFWLLCFAAEFTSLSGHRETDKEIVDRLMKDRETSINTTIKKYVL